VRTLNFGDDKLVDDWFLLADNSSTFQGLCFKRLTENLKIKDAFLNFLLGDTFAR
jgi:hypothetical protein